MSEVARGVVRVDEYLMPITELTFSGGSMVVTATAQPANVDRMVRLLGQPYEVLGNDGVLVCTGRMQGVGIPAYVPVPAGEQLTVTVVLEIGNPPSATSSS